MSAAVIRRSLLAIMLMPLAMPSAQAEEVTAHLDCAATFIHTAQLYQAAGQDGSMFGEFAVQAMSAASKIKPVEAVHADLRERVPAQKAAYAKDISDNGQQQADMRMLEALKRCGERYRL